MWSLGKVLNTPEVVRVYIGWVHFYRSAILCSILIICFVMVERGINNSVFPVFIFLVPQFV